MGAHPWDTAPVWTTVDLVKATDPSIWDAALRRVSVSDPPDRDVAAAAFLSNAIVRAQAYLIGRILLIVDGPEAVATTFAATPGDLTRYTTDRAIVEAYAMDKGRAAHPAVEALAEGVDAWKASLQRGHEFLSTPAPDDPAAPRSTPPRRSRWTGTARSPLANRAQELLG